ncbi:hypothetical protein CBL_10774 [Carabus blaptoides fortunei]
MVRNYIRKTERHSWTQENLQLAIQSVISKTLTTSAASTRYEVPRTTIQYWLNKNPPIRPSLGRFRPVFSPDMEKELGNHIIEVEKLFHGLNPSDVRRIAYEFAERNNISHPFNTSKKIAGKDFLSGFMKRQGNLSLRKPEATSMARVAGFTRHKVNVFFEILESLMKKHRFPAARIFNVDETGISTVQTPKRIIAEKGRKQVGRITTAERGKNITVVGTVSASGTFIPPMIIFPRLRMNQLLIIGAFPGPVGFSSPSGRIDQELFLKYLDHFMDWVRPSVDRPTLLILDGHNSHKSLAAIEKCRNNGVIMVTLPPHTSNRLQPLDISNYGPLKIYLAQEMDRWMTNHPGKRITDYDMAPILKNAYMKAFTPSNIKKGFEKSGIYPFNPDVFGNEDFATAEAVTAKYIDGGLNSPVTSSAELSVRTIASDETDIPDAPEFELQAQTVDNTTIKSLNAVPVDMPVDVQIPSTSRYVTFSDISPLSRPKSILLEANIKKRKQEKSENLTSSPYKDALECKEAEKRDIVKRKLEKEENRKLKKLKVSSAKSSTKTNIKSSVRNNMEEDKEDNENVCFCKFCNGKYGET